MALCVGITDGELLYCHGVSEGTMDKKISTLECNNRTVYDYFNNPFTAYFGIPAMHIPPVTIEYRPPPHKRAQYAPDLLTVVISVSSENSIITLNTPSDYPGLLPTDDPNALHVIKKDVPLKGRFNRGYCSMKHGQIICYKKTRLYCSTFSDKDKKFMIVIGFTGLV